MSEKAPTGKLNIPKLFDFEVKVAKLDEPVMTVTAEGRFFIKGVECECPEDIRDTFAAWVRVQNFGEVERLIRLERAVKEYRTALSQEGLKAAWKGVEKELAA